MCGIFGYSGNGGVVANLMNGLKKLEYRGYDSSGIACADGELTLIKAVGNTDNLKSSAMELESKSFYGGIGHTRWATSGAVSDTNAHPHISKNRRFAIVHNGTIDNYAELKGELKESGYDCVSDTDSEVIAHLIEMLYNGNLPDTLNKTAAKIVGNCAIAVIDVDGNIAAYKRGMPVVVGENEQGRYISSDIPTLSEYCSEAYILNDGETVEIKDTLVFYKHGAVHKKQGISITSEGDSGLNGYSYYMEKEIYEAEAAIENTVKEVYNSVDGSMQRLIYQANQICLIGCGTAFHAAMYGARLFEGLLGIPCRSLIAGEFIYGGHQVDSQTLCIFISQSGETADTIEALKYSKGFGSSSIVITNVRGSSICFLADYVILTKAGTERAVASTKAYIAQLTTLITMAAINMRVEGNWAERLLSGVRSAIEIDTRSISNSFNADEKLFFVGRGRDYVTAREGALKLKEVSYLYCEALAGSELKHGTLALVTHGVTVMAVVTQKSIADKMKLCISEIKARGGKAVILSQLDEMECHADTFIKLPDVDEELMPIVAVIPLQRIALETACNLGFNPDMPRNLAKSVTVE